MSDWKNTIKRDIPTELNNAIINVGKNIYKYRRTKIGCLSDCCLMWELSMLKDILCNSGCDFSDDDLSKVKDRIKSITI